MLPRCPPRALDVHSKIPRCRFFWISCPAARIPSACFMPRVFAEHKGAFEGTSLSVHDPSNRYKPACPFRCRFLPLLTWLFIGASLLFVIPDFAVMWPLSGRWPRRTYLIELTTIWRDLKYLNYKFYWSNSYPIPELSSVPPCHLILLGFPLAYSQTQIAKHLHSKPKPSPRRGQLTPRRRHTPWNHDFTALLPMMFTFLVRPPSCP